MLCSIIVNLTNGNSLAADGLVFHSTVRFRYNAVNFLKNIH